MINSRLRSTLSCNSKLNPVFPTNNNQNGGFLPVFSLTDSLVAFIKHLRLPVACTWEPIVITIDFSSVSAQSLVFLE